MWKSAGTCHVFASFYPGICLTTEEKARKNHSQGKRNFSQGKRNFSQVNKNLSSMTLLIKSCRLLDKVQKYRTAGQSTDDNMAHAHCMLYT
jgi:hypothetical protein